MSLLEQLFSAELRIGPWTILWREVVGNVFGFASALGGMRRRVWAWPAGIIGNALLFTVFTGVWFANPQDTTLAGQAARQVFFIITSVYGWWSWSQQRRAQREAGQTEPFTPRWATTAQRVELGLFGLVGLVLCQWIFRQIGAGWPAPDWYYWADAWIFVGSILATYAMARQWVEFWLLWIAVDLVGVPLLFHSGFIPSAVLYLVYGAFVAWGFVVWMRLARHEKAPGEEALHGAEPQTEPASLR